MKQARKLQATLVRNYDPATDSLTEVRCRATSVAKKFSPPSRKLGKNPVDPGGPKDFRTQSQTCCGKHLPPRSVSSHLVSVMHSSSVPKAQDRPVTTVEVKARMTEMKIREKFMVEL